MAYAEDEPEEEKKTGFWVVTPWGGWTNMAEVPCFRYARDSANSVWGSPNR